VERAGSTSRGRLALVLVIGIGGPVFTVATDLWVAHRFPTYAEGRWLAGPAWDVIFAVPFVLLAVVLLVTGMSRLAAALAALGLAAIMALTFWSDATSDSSTAALAFLIPWLYGFPLVLLAFVVDAAVRAAAAYRARRQAQAGS
jgi:hypothetical protein